MYAEEEEDAFDDHGQDKNRNAEIAHKPVNEGQHHEEWLGQPEEHAAPVDRINKTRNAQLILIGAQCRRFLRAAKNAVDGCHALAGRQHSHSTF